MFTLPENTAAAQIQLPLPHQLPPEVQLLDDEDIYAHAEQIPPPTPLQTALLQTFGRVAPILDRILTEEARPRTNETALYERGWSWQFQILPGELDPRYSDLLDNNARAQLAAAEALDIKLRIAGGNNEFDIDVAAGLYAASAKPLIPENDDYYEQVAEVLSWLLMGTKHALDLQIYTSRSEARADSPIPAITSEPFVSLELQLPLLQGELSTGEPEVRLAAHYGIQVDRFSQWGLRHNLTSGERDGGLYLALCSLYCIEEMLNRRAAAVGEYLGSFDY